MGITVLFVTHEIDEAVYSAARVSDVVVTDRDHGEYRHQRARRAIAAQNAFIGALRRPTQTSLCANPGRQAGTTPGLIREPDM